MSTGQSFCQDFHPPLTDVSSEIPLRTAGTFCLFVIRIYKSIDTGCRTNSPGMNAIVTSGGILSGAFEVSPKRADTAIALKESLSLVALNHHCDKPKVIVATMNDVKSNRAATAGNFLPNMMCR